MRRFSILKGLSIDFSCVKFFILFEGSLKSFSNVPFQAFGGGCTDYSFLSNTASSTPDSSAHVKKDTTQIPQTQQSSNQQSVPQAPLTVAPIKKKKSVVNLFGYGNISEFMSQSSSAQQTQQQTPSQQQKDQPQQSVIQSQIQPSSSCDTSSITSSKNRYNAFNNISFDTNLDFLSFVSLYRSFR